MAHEHATRDGPKCVDVGPTTCLSPFRDSHGHDLAGFIFAHDRPDLAWRCEGAVFVVQVEDRPVWSMSGSLEGGDLTLAPSILCKAPLLEEKPEGGYRIRPGTECGFHGFVRNGAWVPA